MSIYTMMSFIWSSICLVSGILLTLSSIVYLIPLLYLSFIARPQNLRKKYGAWALVTGASSGIGKALVEKLMRQGVNTILVALDDDMLQATCKHMRRRYGGVELRAVGVDLSKSPKEYMRRIRQATDDVSISMVFSNAGYLAMGFFEQRDAQAHVANLECNAIAGVRIIHHFYKRMVDENIKGCISITSSAACFLPSPFAVMYGASKALLTHFATSLAVEADKHNIHVTVVHPSYTHSNLYANAPKLDVIAFLQKFGWTPQHVADAIFTCVGRVVVRDLGTYAIATNLISRLLDAGFMTAASIPFRDSVAPR